ncbi:hypothetical protein CEXT_583081 [Caerostris extrusa]|uniref:Uncharacterized protein n=1 Tax=Caerostris extrusa TaxID=172846 RepID=A0AAV4P3M4_CAEEX|nr:hypothetical protein CEXT_583081 [Caerostris extrusa]
MIFEKEIRFSQIFSRVSRCLPFFTIERNLRTAVNSVVNQRSEIAPMFTIQFRKNNLPEDLWVMSEKENSHIFSENHRCLPVFTIERNLRTASELCRKKLLIFFVCFRTEYL